MKKAILAATAAVAAVVMASSASATVVDPISLPGIPSFDSFSGTVSGNTGTFTDVFNFTLAGPFSAAANLTSISLNGFGNITFTSVTLDGIALNIVNGVTSSADITGVVLTGSSHNLTVSGTGNGSYGGSIVVTSAVPEPATWAMMILGIAAVGSTMRRRALNAQNVRVSFS